MGVLAATIVGVLLAVRTQWVRELSAVPLFLYLKSHHSLFFFIFLYTLFPLHPYASAFQPRSSSFCRIFDKQIKGYLHKLRWASAYTREGGGVKVEMGSERLRVWWIQSGGLRLWRCSIAPPTHSSLLRLGIPNPICPRGFFNLQMYPFFIWNTFRTDTSSARAFAKLFSQSTVTTGGQGQ